MKQPSKSDLGGREHMDGLVDQADAAGAVIRPLLAGLGPVVQSMVLAELTALWIAGHDPAVRDDVTAAHRKMVDDLVPLAHARIRGEQR